MHVLQYPAALFIDVLSYNRTDKRKEMSGLSDRDYHDAIIEATPPGHFGLKYNRKMNTCIPLSSFKKPSLSTYLLYQQWKWTRMQASNQIYIVIR